MANQITDNRTLVTNADDVGQWVGSTTPANNTDIKIQGASSIGEQMNDSVRYVMFDAGATQDWSDNVFYLWVNCGIVGLLATKAAGGFSIRFAGPTDTNFFEFYVGGSDSWPIAVEGGWVQFVVDIEATPSNTGGTPPATTAIQKVGYAAYTATVMTKVGDNTWIDEIRRLPAGSPGIIVEGRNGGTTDWTFSDIVTQLGTTVGTFKNGVGGTFVLNTSIQFGIDDTSTHGFTDTNKTIIWESQEWAPDYLYVLSALGNSGGTTNITMGIKTGTGDDATGAQGCNFLAGAADGRWAMDFDDPNVDGVNFYGCSFTHAGDLQLDDPAVSAISTLYIDCTSATVSNSEQLRNKIIDANTLDGYAFMTTDDLSDIVFSEFSFSDGYAVELTTPQVASQTSKGNLFTGYGITGSSDAAVYNNSGTGLVTISVTSLGDAPTYSNGPSASTLVSADVTLTVTVKDLITSAAIENARVLLEAASGGAAPSYVTVSITASGTTASVAHTSHGMANGETVIIRNVDQEDYNGVFTISNVTINAYDYTMPGSPSSPATSTATITATKGYISKLTNASGIASENTGSVTQPVQGWVRKATGAPYYQQAALTGSITTSGFSQTVLMVSDE